MKELPTVLQRIKFGDQIQVARFVVKQMNRQLELK
jgi:hypothetical protein